ncbi:MAG TPA: hypothetical protein VIM12_15600 [Noviherbaspirillum sp.]|jgi:hypothetical protein|uniref:hypothetical protein n=1 Tax=Noviherbaspirillum sp. TaxID=1926288 RepID=UPI002F9245BD
MTPVFRKVWLAPVLTGALTAVGLVAALLGDDVWDWLSAAALGVPAALCIWYGVLRRRGG